MKITPRIGEFTDPYLSIDEIKEFYHLNDLNMDEKLPYSWSNSIVTMDGVLSFMEDGYAVDAVGLKHVQEIKPYQLADFRLLNAGWAYSDAVLISGEIIRSEKSAGCFVVFDDLLELRKELGRTTIQPIQCVVSRECVFPLDRPIFQTKDIVVNVFTTSVGKRNLEEALKLHSVETKIEIFANDKIEMEWIYCKMKDIGINYLDVSSGGKVIRTLIGSGLLREIRKTVSGQYAGPLNSQNIKRPKLFDEESDDGVYCVYGAHSRNSSIITVHSSAKGWSAIGTGKGMLNSELFVVFKNFTGHNIIVQSTAYSYGLPTPIQHSQARLVDLAIPAPAWASISYSFSVPEKVFNNQHFAFASSNRNPEGDYAMVSKHDFAESVDQNLFIHDSYPPQEISLTITTPFSSPTKIPGVISSTADSVSTPPIPQSSGYQTDGALETNLPASVEIGYAAYPISTTETTYRIYPTKTVHPVSTTESSPIPVPTAASSSSVANPVPALASTEVLVPRVTFSTSVQGLFSTLSYYPYTQSPLASGNVSAPVAPTQFPDTPAHSENTQTYPDWLIDNLHCDLQELLKKSDGYQIKELSGFIISTTGFQTAELKDIISIIKQKGGEYSPNLSTLTTHLITKSLDHESEKLKAARKWNLVVKEKDWILEKTELYLENHYFYFGEGFEASLSKYLKTIIREGGGNFMTVFDSIKQLIHNGIVDQGGKVSEDGIVISPFAQRTTLVSKTEFWIENCIQEGRIITEESVLYKPTKHELPIKGFKYFKFGISGFEEVERLWIRRLINLMGAELTETFCKANTHLIWTETPTQKSKMAKKWKIPLIKVDWILDILEKGFPIESDIRKHSYPQDGSLKMKFSKDSPLVQTRIVNLSKVIETNTHSSQNSSPSEGVCPPINFGEFAATTDNNDSVDLNALNETLENLQNIVPEIKNIKRRYNEIWDESSFHSNSGKISYLTKSTSPKDRLFEISSAKKVKPPKCYFLFSGLSASAKAALAPKIVDFGGELLNASVWDSKCTHLIVESPMHTEKFLSACASGAWILRPQFVIDCASQNAIVNEEEYQLEGESGKISRFWKKQYLSTGKKIFQGWNVVVKLNSDRKANYKRLLEAGGASCFDDLSEVQKKNVKLLLLVDKVDEDKYSQSVAMVQEATFITNYITTCFQPEN
ncbi:SMC5-SMC6 complex localization factor protein 1 [Boothiomyces sp. JEL0866]|nr:SMC5-SMC6 complex localization factor protein 1 [Boothiomyces sp. JEL0866]